jgi:hypothetical protein
MLRFLARFLAVVCAVVFVFVAIAVVFFHPIGTRLLQARTYQEAIAAEGIYNRLPALVADGVGHTLDAGGRKAGRANDDADEPATQVLGQLTPADWETALAAVLPPAYVRHETESALDQLFAWMHSAAPNPVVNVSLAELKRRLEAPETEEAFVRILQTKPPCTAEQLQSSGGLSLGCCPPPEQMPRVREAFRKAMRGAAEQVPDRMDLCTGLTAGDASSGVLRAWTEARARLQRFERWAQWSPVAPMALLLLIAAFAVRSFRGWLLWWGVPCLIAGAVSAVFALPTAPAARWFLSHFVVSRLSAQVPAVILDAGFGLMTTVVQNLLGAALKTAVILAVGGLVAVILAAAFRSRPKPTGG